MKLKIQNTIYNSINSVLNSSPVQNTISGTSHCLINFSPVFNGFKPIFNSYSSNSFSTSSLKFASDIPDSPSSMDNFSSTDSSSSTDSNVSNVSNRHLLETEDDVDDRKVEYESMLDDYRTANDQLEYARSLLIKKETTELTDEEQEVFDRIVTEHVDALGVTTTNITEENFRDEMTMNDNRMSSYHHKLEKLKEIEEGITNRPEDQSHNESFEDEENQFQNEYYESKENQSQNDYSESEENWSDDQFSENEEDQPSNKRPREDSSDGEEDQPSNKRLRGDSSNDEEDQPSNFQDSSHLDPYTEPMDVVWTDD